jgi:hypothetical protein
MLSLALAASTLSLLLQVPEMTPGALELPPQTDAAAQPYLRSMEFKSLDSGETFTDFVLSGSPPISSTDYDGCPHSSFNLLHYTVVIDPETGYVDYPETFGRGVTWTPAEIRSIVGEPRFPRQPLDGMPWADAYAWEKYENAARLSERGGASSLTTGFWWLQAAWAVRLDTLSSQTLMELTSITSGLPPLQPNPGDVNTPYQIQLARYWESAEAAGSLGATPSETAAVIAWLYRSRGEIAATRHFLAKVGASEESAAALQLPASPEEGVGFIADTEIPPSEQLQEIAGYLGNSAELEAEYLQLALDWMLKGWQAGEAKGSREAGTAFLIGELHRRLGDPVAAVVWYDEAAANGRTFMNPALLKGLRELAASGRGF